MAHVLKFFDKLEDRVRGFLSHYPMFYAIIGGIAVVIFWRGVWHTADLMNISPVWSLAVSIVVMMATGLFVSFFIGDRILLTGIKGEKKLAEKTEDEIKQEETILLNVAFRLEKIEKDIDLIKKRLE